MFTLKSSNKKFNKKYTFTTSTKFVDVVVEEFFPSVGWTPTMGKGGGIYSLPQARELYRRLLREGYVE